MPMSPQFPTGEVDSIENARDLRSRIEGNRADSGTLQSVSVAPAPHASAATSTAPEKPPVARITALGTGGALVYKSTFVAEDVASPILVDAGENLTLVAGDPEALEGKLTAYAWDLAGKSATGPKAVISWSDPGLYRVRLMVTDSNGLTDDQTVAFGIAPPPFGVTQNQTSAQVVGANAQGRPVGQAASVKFDVAAAHAGKPAFLVGVKFATIAVDSCDVDVEIVDKDGKTVAKASKGGIGAAEKLDLGALAEGTYTARLAPGDACVARDGIKVSVIETFVPLVNGVLLMAEHH